MLFQTASTGVLRVGVHASFVQEEQQDLQCTPTTSAIYVLEGVSIHLDTMIFEFEEFFEHPPSLPGCTLTLRQLLVRHNREVEQ